MKLGSYRIECRQGTEFKLFLAYRGYSEYFELFMKNVTFYVHSLRLHFQYYIKLKPKQFC